MLKSILKIVVAIVVGVVATAFWLIRNLIALLADGAKQAHAATPGIIAELKTHAATEAAKAPSVASKIDSDLRKMLRIVKSDVEKKASGF